MKKQIVPWFLLTVIFLISPQLAAAQERCVHLRYVIGTPMVQSRSSSHWPRVHWLDDSRIILPLFETYRVSGGNNLNTVHVLVLEPETGKLSYIDKREDIYTVSGIHSKDFSKYFIFYLVELGNYAKGEQDVHEDFYIDTETLELHLSSFEQIVAERVDRNLSVTPPYIDVLSKLDATSLYHEFKDNIYQFAWQYWGDYIVALGGSDDFDGQANFRLYDMTGTTRYIIPELRFTPGQIFQYQSLMLASPRHSYIMLQMGWRELHDRKAGIIRDRRVRGMFTIYALQDCLPGEETESLYYEILLDILNGREVGDHFYIEPQRFDGSAFTAYPVQRGSTQ